MRLSPGRVVALVAGGILGVLFSLLVFVVGVLGGLDAFRERYGLPVHEVAVLNLICGVLAGAIIALLLPVAQRRLGAVVVGYLAAMPFAFSAALAVVPREEWRSTGVPIALFLSGIGAAVGAISWGALHGNL
jgi:hypothetical protein